MIKRILQRLRDILDLEGHPYLQVVFTEMSASSSAESSRGGQKQRPLGLLHQLIDDAFKGMRQFLNGKLHNVARAIADEDSDSTYSTEGIKLDKKDVLSSEKGVVLGHGLRILKQASRTDPSASTVLENSPEHKGSTNRYLGPVSTKPSTYLSNFIIYIATVGDIVDGTDTTHDFNYFSLVYEWPKDDSPVFDFINSLSPIATPKPLDAVPNVQLFKSSDLAPVSSIFISPLVNLPKGIQALNQVESRHLHGIGRRLFNEKVRASTMSVHSASNLHPASCTTRCKRICDDNYLKPVGSPVCTLPGIGFHLNALAPISEVVLPYNNQDTRDSSNMSCTVDSRPLISEHNSQLKVISGNQLVLYSSEVGTHSK